MDAKQHGNHFLIIINKCGPLEPSFLSLIPAIVAIVLAFVTRDAIIALFSGVVAGSMVMYASSLNMEDANFIANFFLPALGQESYARILLTYLWCLGGLMGIWERTGAALYFAETVGNRIVKGPRSSLFFAWLMGCIFHQGGTVSTVLAGATVKPLTDKHRVSHEEVAYVVDSTASPVATILPFNAWPGFIAALIVGTVLPLFSNDQDALAFFFSSIRYNFYGFIAVGFTFLFAMGWLPWIGPRMQKARQRSRLHGKLDRDGASPMLPSSEDKKELLTDQAKGYQPHLIDFALPIGVLLSLTILPYLFLEGSYTNEAFMASLLSAMILAYCRGMQIKEVMAGFIDGCKTMTIGAIILGLAVTIGFVSQELNTAQYLVTLIGDQIPAVALPAVLTLLCMVIAFSCGTSWGTYGVVFPIAMPLAWSIHEDPAYLAVCFGAVLGGAVFGDQCSPISDTTILSSMFTGCDLMDHVNTQLPLALLAAGLGCIASTFSAWIVL
ncbi:sodium:proton antiporter [bacterium]|nr:sodium:proton antiporter [bacterium]